MGTSDEDAWIEARLAESPELTRDQIAFLGRLLSGAPPPERRVRTDSTPTDTRLELTDGALQVIGAMERRVAEVAQEYGELSPEHVEIMQSLVSALAHVFRLGGRITKDDELSLFGASFIAYGVIFHRHRRKDGEPDHLRGTWSLHS
jgi:hypothetical protein